MVGCYSTSTFVGYLMPNPVNTSTLLGYLMPNISYTNTLDIYDLKIPFMIAV